MSAKKISPVEQHFEKAIVGVCAIVFVYIFFAYMLSTPTTIQIDGTVVKPGQAYKLVLEKAKEIENKISKQKWPEKFQKVDTKEFQVPELTGIDFSTLPVAVMPGKEMKAPELEVLKIKEKYDVPKVLPPTKPVFAKGKSTIDISDYPEIQEMLGTEETELDVNWVTVSAELNLEKQREILKNLPRKIKPKEPIYIRVDLQRAEVLPNGKQGKWEDIAPINKDSLLIPPGESLDVNSMSELADIRDELFSDVEGYEASAVNPVFPPVVAGEEWKEPLLPGEQAKKKAEEAEDITPKERARPRRFRPKRPRGAIAGGGNLGRSIRDTVGGGRRTGRRPRGRRRTPQGAAPPIPGEGMGPPPGEAPFSSPGIKAKPGMRPELMPTKLRPKPRISLKLAPELRKKKKTLKIWAHDLTPKPGKTYVYRIRVVMYNPLAGYKPYLKDPSKNLVVGLVSDWSSPTKPITIEKDVYFFVTGLSDDKKGARVVIFKWHKGILCKETFTVYPGERVGWEKSTRIYLKTEEGYERQKISIDFSTGAILAEVKPDQKVLLREPIGKSGEFDVTSVTAGVAVFRLQDGKLISQDTASVIYLPDYKTCKNIIKRQRMEFKKSKR